MNEPTIEKFTKTTRPTIFDKSDIENLTNKETPDLANQINIFQIIVFFIIYASQLQPRMQDELGEAKLQGLGSFPGQFC